VIDIRAITLMKVVARIAFKKDVVSMLAVVGESLKAIDMCAAISLKFVPVEKVVADDVVIAKKRE